MTYYTLYGNILMNLVSGESANALHGSAGCTCASFVHTCPAARPTGLCGYKIRHSPRRCIRGRDFRLQALGATAHEEPEGWHHISKDQVYPIIEELRQPGEWDFLTEDHGKASPLCKDLETCHTSSLNSPVCRTQALYPERADVIKWSSTHSSPRT